MLLLSPFQKKLNHLYLFWRDRSREKTAKHLWKLTPSKTYRNTYQGTKKTLESRRLPPAHGEANPPFPKTPEKERFPLPMAGAPDPPKARSLVCSMKCFSIKVLHLRRRKLLMRAVSLSQLTRHVEGGGGGSCADLQKAFSHKVGSLLPTKKISFRSLQIKGLLVPKPA